MVNAPPTPPPTSSAEIQEAAQAAASRQQEEPLQQPSMSPDPYQIAFPALVDAISRNNNDGLISRAEEIDIITPGGHQLTRLLIVAPLVLAYLIRDEIPPARYTLERLPEHLATLPLSGLLVTLTDITYNRLHYKVYATVTNLFDLLKHPDFFDHELGLILTKLVATFVEAFRQRTFKLLSKAYSSLPINLAQEYLGVPAAAIINEANRYDWRYDSVTQILFPKAGTSRGAPPSSISSLSTLHFVADSAGSLEA